jgi:two-component system, chemotaxis family, CheB/CheR fusion protein
MTERRGKDASPAKAGATPSRSAPVDRPFPIVGVGASAGGLEAFSELLENLPADANLGVVLIQHLPPKQVSILPELLARKTSLPVLSAHDDQLVEPNHVYVLPAGKDMVLFHGRLNLMDRTTAGGLHLPIDYFLRSLAEDQGSRAIGVVLSGAASDGAQGLLAVKAMGGITFAQDPQTARSDGMPRSAIEAGCVDMVLSPAAIAAELTRLGAHPYLHGSVEPKASESVDDGSLYAKMFVMLRSVFGVDFSDYKMATIQRRVARRMALYKLVDLAEYVDYLRTHPAEIEELYQDILIMVTEFFRDAGSFAALRGDVLPRMLDAKPPGAPVRVWVPGCASGEEAYSIAIELARYLGERADARSVKIFATDINERDVARARRGVYSASRLKDVPADYLATYFDVVEGGYEIKRSIREMCIIARHDVTREAPFSQLDLVSCRNLLIYMAPALQERVVAMFHYALRPEGLLLLGPSESVGSSRDLFATVDARHKIFARREGPARLPAEFAYPRGHARGSLAGPPVGATQRTSEFDPFKQADLLVASEHTPPGVIIDGSFRIVQFRGRTGRYLQNLPGAPSTDIVAMAKEGLAVDLRGAIEEARGGGRTVRERVRFRDGEKFAVVDLIVEPLKSPHGEAYFLVLFRAGSDRPKSRRRTRETESPQGQVLMLSDELQATREHLRALVLENDLALEDLRVANEEVQSGNEELQSINEELETAKEELQSTNEELRTVNDELESRNRELSRSNQDLSSLLGGVQLPIIMVDRELRLRRATPAAERVITMVGSDIGRPITDFNMRLQMDDLAATLREVIDNVTTVERQVADDEGHWYSLRVRPYQTRDNHVDGAIVTLVDIDELHRSLDRVADFSRLSEGLSKMADALRSALEPSESFPVALAAAAAAMGAASASFVERDGGCWLVRYAVGLDEHVVGRRYGDHEFPHATLALTTRAPVAIGHAATDDEQGPSVVADHHLRSLLLAPTVLRNEVTGVLLFGWRAPAVQVTEAQIDFAGKMAALVSFALRAEEPER